MYSQHSMGLEEACRDTVLPVFWLMWTLNTIRTRVFLRPMSVSPFLSSMSELRSFKIPAQSILLNTRDKEFAASQNITCINDFHMFTVHQDVIDTALQPHRCVFTSSIQRLQPCQQKINTPAPKELLHLSASTPG